MWENIKLAWALPHDFERISYPTHASMMAMFKPNIIYLNTPLSGDIAEKREGQCKEALRQGCTHIFICDGDMVYYPEFLVKAFAELEKGADMVGGLCYRGDVPYDPILHHPTIESERLYPFRDFQFGDVVDAGATGAACLLVKKEVFEGLEPPWFRLVSEETSFYVEDGEEKRKITQIIRRGEDTYFTRKATQAGFKLRIITEEDIGHMREFQIDRHFWLLFGIVNKLGDWRKIAVLFKKVHDGEWVKKELCLE